MIENLSNKVLQKIKKEDVRPKSKFSFLAKNYAYWAAAFVSILIGAVTVSAMIFVFVSNDWVMAPRVGGFWKSLAYVLPYFWLAIFALFVLITHYNIKNIEGGYKVAMPIILISYFAATLILGSLLFKIGVGNRIENAFVERAPFYAQMTRPRHQLWQNPEAGLLVGQIISANSTTLQLLDLEKNEWQVEILEAKIPVRFELQERMPIRLIGQAQEDFIFIAEGILPQKLPMKPMLNGEKCPNCPRLKELRDAVRNSR